MHCGRKKEAIHLIRGNTKSDGMPEKFPRRQTLLQCLLIFKANSAEFLEADY